MKRPGTKVYLVCYSPCSPDGGWPVSAFSTKEKAMEECRMQAEKKREQFEGMGKEYPENLRETFFVQKSPYKDICGYFVKARSARGGTQRRIYERALFYIEEYALDRSAREYW